MVAVSNSGNDAISRAVAVSSAASLSLPLDASRQDIAAHFETSRTTDLIKKHSFSRIALQFPDSLLPYSSRICEILESGCGPLCKLYVLADTSYGACCVDEVAAEHVNSDLIVHYGPACLSP